MVPVVASLPDNTIFNYPLLSGVPMDSMNVIQNVLPKVDNSWARLLEMEVSNNMIINFL